MDDTTTNAQATESELEQEREFVDDTQSEHLENDSDELEVKEESLETLLDDVPSTTPKLSKEEKQRLNAESIASDWAEKLLNGVVEEDDIPEWVKPKAIRLADQVRDDDKLTQMESKWEQKISSLEQKYSQKEAKEAQQESEKLIRRFMDINSMNENEFVKTHGLQFKQLRDKYQQSMSKVEATEIALLKITSIGGLEEATNLGKARSGLIMPPSSVGSSKPSTNLKKELAEYNAELANVGASPISEQAFKKAKEQGIL